MEQLNLTVKQFVDHYVSSNTKIRVIKSFKTIFEGTLDEIYYSGMNILYNIVSMVDAEENYICLFCRP